MIRRDNIGKTDAKKDTENENCPKTPYRRVERKYKFIEYNLTTFNSVRNTRNMIVIVIVNKRKIIIFHIDLPKTPMITPKKIKPIAKRAT